MFSPAPEPRIAYADDASVIAVVGRLIIMDWRGQVVARHFEAIRTEHHALLRSFPDGTVGIHLTGEGVRLPQGRDRAAAFDLARETSGSTRSVGIHIGAQGFVASALQSFAIGLFSIFGNAKAKSFRSVDPLCDWLAEQGCDVGSSAQLRALVDSVQAHTPTT